MIKAQAKNISINYPIFNSSTTSIKNKIFSKVGGGIGGLDGVPYIKAIDNLSFTFVDGDRVGLIGHNGAGKSTLLKAFSRVYNPQIGSFDIYGEVTSLIELGLGIESDLSGAENINRKLIMMRVPKEMRHDLKRQIINFTELGDYISMPVRTYSSGMWLRLVFAIATSTQPDILVMDELIGAGDEAFRNKAKDKIYELIDKSGLLVLASHDESLIRKMCNKVLLLNRGQLVFEGSPDLAFIEYHKILQAA